MLRLKDVTELHRHAPSSWRGRAVHLDPDLNSAQPTYGDNCRRAGRAFSLRRAKPDDLIVFLARLHPRDRPAGFHLVGCLDIKDALADVTDEPGRGWWDGNAHVRRARAIDKWDSFWVFKGGSASHLFKHAVPFTKPEAQVAFGDSWRWLEHRTEPQTIGSYTRAVRRLEGAGEEWLRTICLS